jgi:hypothetical protein
MAALFGLTAGASARSDSTVTGRGDENGTTATGSSKPSRRTSRSGAAFLAGQAREKRRLENVPKVGGRGKRRRRPVVPRDEGVPPLDDLSGQVGRKRVVHDRRYDNTGGGSGPAHSIVMTGLRAGTPAAVSRASGGAP